MATAFIPLAAGAFLAVTLLQSGLDKLLDRAGNLEYLTDHFKASPLRSGVGPMFVAVTILEIVAGVLCAAGVIMALIGLGDQVVAWGLELSAIDLLCLLFGQRVSKDYGGAAVLTGYF